MALSFISNSIKISKRKTAYHTHFLTSKALHQQSDEAASVPNSRGSTFSRHYTHRLPTTPSGKSSSAIESEHLPPIVHPSKAVFRRHLPNGFPSARDNDLSNNHKSSPTSDRKYLTKTMSTTTTLKKAAHGGPVMSNGSPSKSTRTASSESNQRVRRLWWSPKRNEIEIRSDENTFRHVQSKIGSLANIEHRPGGGQISIRDEPVQWQVTSKINSLANANWSPPPPRVIVRREKIKWDAQPKVGSMINIDHKPAGGNVAIRDEKFDLSHIVPRVDCGFVD